MMMVEGWVPHTGLKRYNYCAITYSWLNLLFCSSILAVHRYTAITYDVMTAICNLLLCLLYLFAFLTPVTPSANCVGVEPEFGTFMMAFGASLVIW